MAGLIPQDFIDDVVARADIAELIGRRVRLKRQGREFAALCPFHQEKSPSFTVSPQKQFFHCFGCGAHGTVLGFLMRYEHLDFVQAVERLADELGLEVPREGGEVNPHAALYEALAQSQRLFAAALEEAAPASSYLDGRGITAEAIEAWGFGYAPGGGEVLATALVKQGLDMKTLSAAGLVGTSARGPYDRFRDRVTLPIRDTRGRIVGFGARSLGAATPKYLNSPETPVFHKGRMLYGLYEARQRERRLERLVVVEGYMDVIALAIAGFGAAVATLGTAVTEAQARLLFGTGAGEVIYCFDGDAAGERAAWRALEQTLPALAPGRDVRFAFLPSGEDPDSLVRKSGLAAFEAVLADARPLSVWLLDSLAGSGIAGAEDKARFAGALKPLINRIADPMFREAMLVAAAERIGLPLARFTQLMDAPTPSKRRSEPNRPVAGESAKPAATPVALHPRVEWLLRRLLAEPQAIAGVEWPKSLEGLDLAGLPILREMLATLARSPDISTAGLLEHWRDRPEAARLGRLAAGKSLLVDPEQLRAEFRDSLRRLEREPRRVRFDELQQYSAERPLSVAEQRELSLLNRLYALEGAVEGGTLAPDKQAEYESLLAQYARDRAGKPA
ncbi:MAG: DNA primase [Gammaproteobacteria bacterium]